MCPTRFIAWFIENFGEWKTLGTHWLDNFRHRCVVRALPCVYEQSEWPDSRWDCVTVCDGCHTVVWGTFWDDYDSAARDAYFARNGWRNYCVPGDTEILELCPACAVRALRRGETRGLADTWLRPTHAYTHAFREVDAQLSARERVVANLLLTEGRTA